MPSTDAQKLGDLCPETRATASISVPRAGAWASVVGDVGLALSLDYRRRARRS